MRIQLSEKEQQQRGRHEAYSRRVPSFFPPMIHPCKCCCRCSCRVPSLLGFTCKGTSRHVSDSQESIHSIVDRSTNHLSMNTYKVDDKCIKMNYIFNSLPFCERPQDTPPQRAHSPLSHHATVWSPLHTSQRQTVGWSHTASRAAQGFSCRALSTTHLPPPSPWIRFSSWLSDTASHSRLYTPPTPTQSLVETE